MALRSESWLVPFAAFLAGALAIVVAALHAPTERERLDCANALERTFAALRWPGPAPLHENEFRLTRDADHPLLVTEERTQDLPYVFGDCDLEALFEVPEGGHLDVVVRRVEFALRERQGHARFAALRLSARAEGPAWRSREELVFGGGDDGGVRVTAGLGVSVRLQMRGRSVHANVAGRALTPFLCDDARGAIAFVVRGGTAVVRHLRVSAPLREARAEPFFLAGLWTALAGVVVVVCGARRRAALGWLVLVPLGGWLAREGLFAHLAPLAEPSRQGALLGALWLLPLWMALALGRARAVLAGVGLVASCGLFELATRCEARRLEPLADARLDLVFGRASNTAAFDAFAGRLRSRTAVHTVRGDETRVLFLGGEDLLEPGDQSDQWLGVQVGGALAAERKRPVEAIVAATRDAHTLQQFALWKLFHERFAPKVVVFGVPSDESEPRLASPARALWERSEAGRRSLVPEGWSRAFALLRVALAPRVPAASADDLRATLHDVRALCTARGAGLVLVTGTALDDELAAVVSAFAAEHGIPWVRDVLGADGKPRTEEVVRAVRPLLRD